MRCGKASFANVRWFCLVATRANALWQRCCRGVLVPAVGSQPARMRCGKELTHFYKVDYSTSQPARMRCGKERVRHYNSARSRCNPRECAVEKCFDDVWICGTRVATRTNALWQSFRSVQTVSKISRRNPRECAVAKMGGYSDFFCCYVATRTNALWQSDETCKTFTADGSQPARMRCGKVAPLLCPNRKLREHELRSSFLVSPPVILVVTFYMTAQLLKRFSTCTAKTAASKLSDAAVYSFNK